MKRHAAIISAALAVGLLGWGPRAVRASTNEGDDPNNSVLPNQIPGQTSNGLSAGVTPSGTSANNSAVNSGATNSGVIDTNNQTARANNDLVSQQSTNGVEQALAQLTQAALSGKSSDLYQYLSDRAQTRLSKTSAANEQQAQPSDRITQFQNDWRAKFGNSFNVADASRVYGDTHVQIVPGDMSQRARLAGDKIPPETDANALQPGENKPIMPNDSTVGSESGMNVGDAGSAAIGAGGAIPAPADAAGATLASNNPGQLPPDTGAVSSGHESKHMKNRTATPGNTRATVIMAADHSLPGVEARFINESEQWKLDIPHNLDADKIQQNLQEELGKLDDDKANWGDEAQAQRMVTHAVLAALTDANAANGSAPTEQLPH